MWLAGSGLAVLVLLGGDPIAERAAAPTEYDRAVIDAVLPAYWLEVKHWRLRKPGAIFVGRIEVTIDARGNVTSAEVLESSGAKKLDRAIRFAFREVTMPTPETESTRSFLFVMRPDRSGEFGLRLSILPARPRLPPDWRCSRRD